MIEPELCPKCGGVMMPIMLTSIPPINMRLCSRCGFKEEME